MSGLAIDHEAQLHDAVAEFYADPLGFVKFAWQWGEPGELQHEAGPDDNQSRILRDLGDLVAQRRFNGSDPVEPIRLSIASGHGTGKSILGAWIVNWIMSTRPASIGTVTAGTYQQLESRTWAAIKHWTKLSITGHWFDIGAGAIKHKQYPDTWKCTPQTCKEENAQAFAGQHARTSTSWYLFDEASQVPDAVWKVAYGGLTDGEPMMFVWGQPERNTGEFHRVTFGSLAPRWNHRTIDSRTSRFTNKEYIQELEADYGLESDYYRVRVLGLPPSASELQYIDAARVQAAQTRRVEILPDEPLVAGLDVSGGGKAWNVFRFRRGRDARSVPPVRISGEMGRDRSVIIGQAAEILRRKGNQRVSAMFVDTAFGAPVVERLRALGFENVFEVGFGNNSPDKHDKNMRSYMYRQAKDWLERGAIDTDEKLFQGLTLPGYSLSNGQLVIESKAHMDKREPSIPRDDADAFVLTFAQPVAPVNDRLVTSVTGANRRSSEASWMGTL